MAIIGKIRKHSGLAVIIVGVAIAAFVIGDFGKQRSGGTNNIGVVNDEKIPYLEFNNQVEENLEIQRENAQTDKLTEEAAYSIRQNTWNTMVKDLIMGEEYSELGITVSPEELFDQVQGINPHRYILQYFKDPNTGMYNPSVVLNYLKNLDQMEPKAKTQWLQFEKAIKEDRRETKFNNLVTKGYYMPTAFLKKEHELQTKTLKLRYISPSIFSIPDSSIQLTDADYETFYEKNKDYFYNQEASVDLDFVVFEVVPSAEDKRTIEADVRDLFADFSATSEPLAFASANSDNKFDTTFYKRDMLPGELDSILFNSPVGTVVSPLKHDNAWYMARLLSVEERPDSMEGYQLLITWDGTGVDENVKRTKEQAKIKADSLLAALKSNPFQFSEITRQISDYPPAKKDGGKLEWFTDGDPNFTLFFDEGLTMKPNEMKVMETRIGYSVFMLSNKTAPNKKVKTAVLQRNIVPSNQTFQDYYLRASAFAGQNKTPEAFDTAAISSGLNKRQAQSVKAMDNNLMGLPNAREIVRWAFAEPTQVGEVSPVFDLSGKYTVAILKEKYDKGYQPIEKIKSRLTPSVMNMKKIEITAGNIDDFMKTNQDFTALAEKFSARVDTVFLTFSGNNRSALSREPETVGTVFTLPKEVVSGPFKGNFGVYVVLVDEIIDAPAKEDYTYDRRQLQQNFISRAPNSLFEALKEGSEIEDNRIWYY